MSADHLGIDGVLLEVADERYRQNLKWGEQNHLDGTGGVMEWRQAEAAKRDTDKAAQRGQVTWRQILNEEVREAFAESNEDALRAELVQVAAVATQWIEALDRRAGQ